MRYIDYASSYLPGEVYRSGLKEYTPQQRMDYRVNKKFKFKPDKNGASMMTFQELLNVSNEIFEGKFKTSKKLVLEEFLKGEEASYFLIVDKKSFKFFGSAQDHKRVGENDRGANTGGMGAYSPAPIITKKIEERIPAIRDSIGKIYVPGRVPGSYMITERAYLPYYYKTSVNNLEALLTKGTWEVQNDFMAGPYVNYIIKDTLNERNIVVEGFSFAPSESKRDYMFELNTIITTMKQVN